MPLPPLSEEQRVKPPRFELRLALLYGAVFLPLGIHLPYLPLWLAGSGFDAQEIGVILAAPMFLRVVTTPVITALADKAADRVFVLALMAALAFAVSLGYFLPTSYAVVLATSLLLAVAITPQTPLADSLALSGVRRFGSVYARMRIWGSISFLLANFGGGLILSQAGTGAVPFMISFGLASVLALSLFAPRMGRPRLASPLSVAELPRVRSSLFDLAFMLLVGGAGLIAASHAFLYGFASLYWQSIGLGEATVGILWSAAVVAEVVMFMVFARLLSHLAASTVMALAAAAAIVRWIAFPMIVPLGLGVAGFLAVQALHAFSIGLILIGVQKVIAETVPEERTGAAQGVAYFANGFAMAAVTLVSGPLYARFGVGGFFPMAAVAGVGLVLVLLARLRSRSSERGGKRTGPV